MKPETKTPLRPGLSLPCIDAVRQSSGVDDGIASVGTNERYGFADDDILVIGALGYADDVSRGSGSPTAALMLGKDIQKLASDRRKMFAPAAIWDSPQSA